MVLTMWLITTITFFLMYTLPGDPVQTRVKQLPPTVAHNLTVKWGFDKPLYVQYLTYMDNLLHGNFGESMKTLGVSANTIIAEAFPHSARLGMQALVLSVVAGLLLGVMSAFTRGRLPDQIVMFIAIIGVSIPSFVVASLLQIFLGGKLFPIIGWTKPNMSFFTGIRFTVLPTISLAFGSIAVFARFMRSSALDVLGSDHILTAKAKGLSDVSIFGRHIFRNSMMPIITIFASQFSGLITGSFVIETIFGIPGIGQYYVNCVVQRDFTMIMATTVFFSIIFVASIAMMDILYVLADPRVRLASEN